jgi:hypothetical protein
MASLDHLPQAEASDLQSFMARAQEEEAPVDDADGKPVMSSRAIRNGLVFSAVFYSVIGGVGWLALRLL